MALSATPTAFEGELHCMIREYLEYIGLVDAKISFEEECKKARKPIDASNYSKVFKDERAAKLQTEMFKFFDSGQRSKFFQTWDCCISADIREGDSWCQKLEFYLNLYFAVHPLKVDKNAEDCEDAMCQFRYYLETKGAPLSQTPDFLPYYALPFVPNPRSHESFRELFEPNWSSDLRIKLETFLGEVLRETASTSPHPRLIELYHCNNVSMKEVRDNLRISEKKLSQTEKRCTSQSKQLMKFQDDYQKLMGVTAELITALEAAVKGDWVDIDQVLSSCSSRFPEIFNPGSDSSQNTNAIKPINGERPSSSSGMQRFKETLKKQSEKVSLMTSLQFDQIKKDLVGSDLRTKLLLVQALRWRITRKCDREETILNSYISNDILGCEKPTEYRQKILHNIRSPSEALRQSFARFLNVFASFSAGRTYLAQCPQLLAVLIENIKSDDPDQVTLDMTLGTLQKLSLRTKLQTSMIEGDLVDWLITTLEEHVTLSEYSLEYASALLMNLCLRSAGKNSCIRYPRRALSLLISLLDMGQRHTSIIPYVNGALYSLLSVPAIRTEAIKFGLSKVLEAHMEQSNPEMKRQYEYIMKQLNSNNSKRNDSCSDDEEDEDDDDDEEDVELDPELDKNDLVTERDGELIGEKLLSAKYVNKKHDIKETLEKGIVNRTQKLKNDVLKRPVTPQLNNNNKAAYQSTPSYLNAKEEPQARNPRSSSGNKENINKNILKEDEISTRTSPSEGGRDCSSQRETFSSSLGYDSQNYVNTKSLSASASSTDNFFSEVIRKTPSRHSRLSTADSISSANEFHTSPLMNSFRVDREATDLVSRVTGKETHLVEAEKSIAPANHFPGLNTQEYVAAFSTRPRIPRTPDSTASCQSPRR